MRNLGGERAQIELAGQLPNRAHAMLRVNEMLDLDLTKYFLPPIGPPQFQLFNRDRRHRRGLVAGPLFVLKQRDLFAHT